MCSAFKDRIEMRREQETCVINISHDRCIVFICIQHANVLARTAEHYIGGFGTMYCTVHVYRLALMQ